MARITVEDCLTKENNRFALVQLASKRTKQLLSGAKSVNVESKSNKAVVTALREIAAGRVRFMTEEEICKMKEEEALKAQAAPSSSSSGVNAVAVSDSSTVPPGGNDGSSDSSDENSNNVVRVHADNGSGF